MLTRDEKGVNRFHWNRVLSLTGIGYTHPKKLTFHGDPVTDTDSGSLFRFHQRCGPLSLEILAPAVVCAIWRQSISSCKPGSGRVLVRDAELPSHTTAAEVDCRTTVNVWRHQPALTCHWQLIQHGCMPPASSLSSSSSSPPLSSIIHTNLID